MFRSIRKKIFCWFKDAEFDDCNLVSSGLVRKRHPTDKSNQPVSAKDNDTLDSDGMNFKIINGRGGIAIEIRTRDPKTGEYTIALYVIPEDQDLAQELAKIITMQTLRY